MPSGPAARQPSPPRCARSAPCSRPSRGDDRPPSASTRVSGRPASTIGSSAMVIPGRSSRPLARRAVVRHLWVFVHRPPDPVAGVFAGDAEARDPRRSLLDRRRNVPAAAAGAASPPSRPTAPARVASSGARHRPATSPTATVSAESPTKPSTIAPQSMLTISPSRSRRLPGMPCTSSSLTLTVVTAG